MINSLDELASHGGSGRVLALAALRVNRERYEFIATQVDDQCIDTECWCRTHLTMQKLSFLQTLC